MTTETFARINGADIFHTSIGSGPPVLVLHGGLGLSHDYLRPYFDALAETHTVIYCDQFGNGRSTRPADFTEMTIDRLSSDAGALMTHLGYDRFVLIGHSYGGFIAQDFATKHADRLDRLALIDTVPAFDYAPNMSGTEEQMAAFGRLFSEPMADDTDLRDTWGKVVAMYFKDYDPVIGADLDARTHYSHGAWNTGGGLLGTFNTIDALPEIKVPTWVATGRHDPITPPEHGGTRIASLMPNATLAIFENSAHYPFIEDEAAFFAELKEWLAR